MSTGTALRVSSAVRIVYGLVSLLAPQAIFRMSPNGEPDPDTRYFSELFGGRDISIAGATLVAVGQGREREATMLSASCEATDTVALLQEVRQRGGVDQTVAVALGFNVVGWLLVAAARRGLR